MEELAADPVITRRLPVVSANRCCWRLAAAAQHGHDRREPAAAHPLPVLPRPELSPATSAQPGPAARRMTGQHRMHAILGTSAQCIALHASDLAVALMALDAVLSVLGADGVRAVPLTEFYSTPGDTPGIENMLGHGELITSIRSPAAAEGTRSGYLKVRDRASYEFALASAAVALETKDGVVRDARVALGGWRRSRGAPARRGRAARRSGHDDAFPPRQRSAVRTRVLRARKRLQGRAGQADDRPSPVTGDRVAGGACPMTTATRSLAWSGRALIGSTVRPR